MTHAVIQPDQGRWLNIFGNHTCVKLSGADTQGEYTLLEHRDPPGLGVPLHVHGHEDEIFYVVQGQVRFQVGDETLVVGAGTTVSAPRGVPHSYHLVGQPEACVLIFASPSGIETMFEELDRLPSDAPPDMAQVSAICARYGVRFLPAGAPTN